MPAAVLKDHLWELTTSTYTQSNDLLGKISAAVAVDRIGEAIAVAAGNAASNVALATRTNAKSLLALLADKPAPEITVESTGEITLEWYKDRYHVAILTVDGPNIRWAAVLAPNTPAIAGVEPFSGSVPTEALQAVHAAT